MSGQGFDDLDDVASETHPSYLWLWYLGHISFILQIFKIMQFTVNYVTPVNLCGPSIITINFMFVDRLR